jgi:NAD(P)-dependent dehydrogenase (short-subunit alcohol dehydrogenase family)
MINLFDFTGKNILIAGAASGIGRETAILLSQMGARLVLIDNNEKELFQIQSSLENQNHIIYTHDLSILNGIERLISEIVDLTGQIDGFVFTVGVRSRRPLSLLTPELFIKILSINAVAFIELIRSITKRNRFNKGLSIVGISSIASVRGAASVTAYAASKAAMDAAVRCLAKELAPKKIRINTVMPSQINTHAYHEFLKTNDASEDATLSRQYLGLGEPKEVSNVIAFLLSDNSGFITGSSLPVDGGFLTS